VYRLRRWLRAQELSIEIENLGNFYRLRPRSVEIVLRLTKDKVQLPTDPRLQEFIYALELAFGNSFFSAKQVAQHMKLSDRSTHRQLAAATTTGLIERLGSGKSTRYQVRAGSIMTKNS
jgi:hypothetical protein